MHVVINDILYSNVEGFTVRNLETVIEVKFNNLTLIIRDPAAIVRVNENTEVHFESLESVYAVLLKDDTTEFEHKTI